MLKISMCVLQVIPYFTLVRDQAAAAEGVHGEAQECKADMSDEECAYVAAGQNLASMLGKDSSPFSASTYGLITGGAFGPQRPSGLPRRRSSRHLSRRALSKRSECLAQSDRRDSSQAVDRLPAVADCTEISSGYGPNGPSRSDLPTSFRGMQPLNIMSSGTLRAMGLHGPLYPHQIFQKGTIGRMRQALSKSSHVVVVALSK